eukprot:gene838-1348_t
MRPGPAATPPVAVAAAAAAPLPRQMHCKLGDTSAYVPRSHFLTVKEADRIVHKLCSQLLEGDASVAQLQRAADAHDWR